MEYRILGPLEVGDNGTPIDLPGNKPRALLAILLLHANDVVGREMLIDELWGDEPPETATTAIQVHVSQLRKALGRDAIETLRGGYRISARNGELDALRFEQLLGEARGMQAAEAADRLRDALALWRGQALADLAPDVARPERAALDQRRLAALERRIDADLELGRAAELLAELESLVHEQPLHERFRGQLMLALYRSGRQADALAVYREGRRLLDDELGLEPGDDLKRLERAILEQDPAISPPPTLAERLVSTAGRRRRVLLAVGALVLLSALAAAIAVARPWSSGQEVGDDNQVVGLDASGKVVRVGGVSGTPVALAAAGSSIWVGEPGPSLLERVDASSGEVVGGIPLDSPPGTIAVAGAAVWVTTTTGGTVMRVRPEAARVVQTVPLGAAGPSAIAAGPAGLWAMDSTDRTLLRIDPVSGKPVKRITLDFSPTALAVGRSLWVADYSAGRVSEIDPKTRDVLGSVHVGNGPVAVAIGAGAVWVASSLDGTVSRIDLDTRSVVETVPVGSGPAAVAVTGDSVWVATRYSGMAVRIDSDTNQVAERVPVGSRPGAVVADGERVWVGSGASGIAHRGGTLVLATTDSGWMSDPAVYERTLPTQFSGLAYDTLVTFQHVDGPSGLQLVPDLATAIPTPAEGGTTYAFHLQQGVRYSDGRPLHASDFRRAFVRLWTVRGDTFPPPGAARYLSILGMDRCRAAPWDCKLTRGIVTDDAAGTVVFHLKAPDPDFLYSLTSFAFSAPIPPGTQDPTFGRTVPGTGPYRVASEDERAIRFVRNRYFREWSPAAQPDGYPDAIVWRFARNHVAVVDAIEKGRADWTFDLVPPAQLQEVRLRGPATVHVNPWYLFQYVALNPRAAPFDDVRVRRALNLAIDRRVVVAMYGGADVAHASCQPLVPGLPGYERYCPYTREPSAKGEWRAPDLEQARRLVAQSGTRGDLVDVYKTAELAIPSPLPAYVAGVLASLGYRVRLHKPADDIGDEHQLYVHGDWLPDWPEPSSYMSAFFGCSGAHNTYSACDPALDREMALATSLQSADPKRAAELWAEVDRAVVAKAWWVPTVTPLGVDLVSSRVGNYRFHPLWGFMADQAWVR